MLLLPLGLRRQCQSELTIFIIMTVHIREMYFVFICKLVYTAFVLPQPNLKSNYRRIMSKAACKQRRRPAYTPFFV